MIQVKEKFSAPIKQHHLSPLKKLDHFIDEEGLMRVGARLQSADLSDLETHPLIIPASHHVATFLVRHYHNPEAHQGRQFTEGTLCTAGLSEARGSFPV